MSTTLSDTTLDRERVAVSTVWSAGLMASLSVVVANVAIWIVLVPLAGLDLEVPSKFGSTELQDLSLATVVFVSVISALAGVVLLWATDARRATRRHLVDGGGGHIRDRVHRLASEPGCVHRTEARPRRVPPCGDRGHRFRRSQPPLQEQSMRRPSRHYKKPEKKGEKG